MPRLYSYIVARDYGFAPNPFYGFCTLATCKPNIRKSASVGDWVIGTGTKKKNRGGHLVFAMRVTEMMSFDDYWTDPRFRGKRADLFSSQRKAYGDNIYHRNGFTREWDQIDSHHSYADGAQNVRNINNDTQVDKVLVSDDFVYWGGSGPPLQKFCGANLCHTTQGHRCRFPEEAVDAFIRWIRQVGETGYCGSPLEWD